MAEGSGPMESLVMNTQFWQGKRVFLTGQTGFKGGWLSLWLQQLGATLTGYALPPPTLPNLYEAARVGAGMNSVIGDIRDPFALAQIMQEAEPEIVFHLAAQPLVLRSYEDPVETYSTNVMGTVHLLEAIRKCPSVRAVVNVTTDKCYDNKEWVWAYREDESLGGYDPYSSSKGCSEMVTSAYRNSFFNPNTYIRHRVALASARAGNVIGGGDWSKDRLIPDTITAFMNGKSVTLRNPLSIRPWQHVLEPLRGYLTLAENLFISGTKFAEAFNFGPRSEDAKPVQTIVDKLSELWGEGSSWQIAGVEHLHEANFLKLDTAKAAQMLNWRPQLNIDQALQLTVDWSKGYQQGLDMQALTKAQIYEYQTNFKSIAN